MDAAAGPDGLDRILVRTAFAPPTEYYAWWEEIRTCSGGTGSISDVRFLRAVEPTYVYGTQFPCGETELCNGLWEAPHDITLAPAHLDTPRLVKHEMLHDLLGVPGHPDVFEECDVTWGPSRGFDVVPNEARPGR